MSGVFYVFLKWSPNNDVSASHYGRYMLCLNSRYDADELFRAMQGLRTANGSDLMFPLLTRQSPQFWCYDSPENWVSIGLFQERNQLPEFKNRLSLLLLNDRGGREWPIIPNPVSGPDWVSGGNFFIRNRRQPNIYWNLHDTHIYTSTKRRTKFHIQKIKSKGEREPVIMIREDTVTIQVIPETVTSEAVADGSTYVSISNSKGHRLTLTRVETKWTFGELVNEKVGVRWEGERNSPEQPPAAQPFLVHMSNGGGDEWELV